VIILAECAFLIVPIQASNFSDGWETLDRSARLAALKVKLDHLGRDVQARLPELEVEFLNGVGGWTVRTPEPMSRSALALRLRGLPVEVAPDERFYAA
jgi:hypothetical protein